MYVIKRDGRKEDVHCQKISSRILKLCYGLNLNFIHPEVIQAKVTKGLFNGVTTVEFDNLAAETATMAGDHNDYAVLANRLSVSNLHKETKKLFSDVMDDLYNAENAILKQKSPLISEYHHKIILENADRLKIVLISFKFDGLYESK